MNKYMSIIITLICAVLLAAMTIYAAMTAAIG